MTDLQVNFVQLVITLYAQQISHFSVLSLVASDRMHKNGSKLLQERFRLGMGKHFYILIIFILFLYFEGDQIV